MTCTVSNRHSWIFTCVLVGSSPRSYIITSATVRIGVYTAPRCGTKPIRYVTLHVKTCKRWQAAHLHRRETFENLLHIAPLRRTLSGILQFEIWTMISLLYSGPRYGSVQFMLSKGKLCKLSRTFQMYNRQFIQFARIPVEFVARLWDMSTQKYNNFSIAAVILGYLLLISP